MAAVQGNFPLQVRDQRILGMGTDGWFYIVYGGQARVRDRSGILFCGALDGGNLRVGMAFDGWAGLKRALAALQKRYSG